MRGASKTVQNNKGETPGDLAKKPDICALFGKELDQSTIEENSKPAFVPAYLAQPELSKLWSLPEGSTDDPKLNQEAFTLSNPKLPASTPVPQTGVSSAPSPAPATSTSSPTAASNNYGKRTGTIAALDDFVLFKDFVSRVCITDQGILWSLVILLDAKEILVYRQSVIDENLLGAIFANVEDTIEKTIQLIKEVIKDNCDLLWHSMTWRGTY